MSSSPTPAGPALDGAAPERAGVPPLLLAAAGLVAVVADPALNGVDVLPDTVGWLLVLVAALRLDRRGVAGVGAATAAGLAAVAAVPFLPAGPVAVPGLVAGVVAVGLVARAASVRADAVGEHGAARGWSRLALVWAAAGAVLVTTTLEATTATGEVTGSMPNLSALWSSSGDTWQGRAAVAVAALCAAVVLRLARDADEPWALRPR